MNAWAPWVSSASRSATAGEATRISPSAPTPRCRSQRAATRSSGRSRSPSQSSTITKSFPVPCHFSNRNSAISQVLRQLVHDAGRAVRSCAEPPDAGVAPEPRQLPPGQGPGPCDGPGDGLVQGHAAGQVVDDLSVPDGLARSERWTGAVRLQLADLVEQPPGHHRPDAGLDPPPVRLRVQVDA